MSPMDEYYNTLKGMSMDLLEEIAHKVKNRDLLNDIYNEMKRRTNDVRKGNVVSSTDQD